MDHTVLACRTYRAQLSGAPRTTGPALLPQAAPPPKRPRLAPPRLCAPCACAQVLPRWMACPSEGIQKQSEVRSPFSLVAFLMRAQPEF